MGLTERLQRAWLSRGWLACSLLPVAACYGALLLLRRNAYRLGWRRPVRLPVPVVVVGNLVVGGAGKTPTVIAVVHALQRQGHVVGVVSRGYGRANSATLVVQPDTPVGDCGDEPLLLRLRTGVPVCVGRDRVAAGQALLQRHPEIDVIVSDDGLQHWRLARQAQILVFDERGAGNGWLLPAGPLREPLPKALPPRSMVLYNAEAATTPLPGSLAQRGLRGVVDLAGWWAGQPASLSAMNGLRERPLLAAAGLARPQRFFDMLRLRGLTIEPLPLADHHDYTTLPWPADTAAVVVTEKDAVKLRPGRMGSTRVWVAPLDFSLPAAVEAALAAWLPVHSGETHGNATARPAGVPDLQRPAGTSAPAVPRTP